MEMRDGTLGVVTIAAAIAIAVFGSYLAGVTAEENEVTKFNYLADVSGQFNYNQSPQYVEFDPSTNYTGYYSSDSYTEFLDKYYFADDQVGFRPNGSVNNYRLDLEPETSVTETWVLQPDGSSYPFDDGDHRVSYTFKPSNPTDWSGYYTFSSSSAEVARLSDYLEMTNFYETYPDAQIIYIRSIGSLEETTFVGGTTADVSFLTFARISDWVYSGGRYHLTYYDQEYMDEYNIKYGSETANIKYCKICQSCKIDLEKSTATIYYSPDCTGQAYGEFTLDSVTMIYGGSESGSSQFEWMGYINFDSDASVRIESAPPKVYLDPNYGVWLKEAA